VSSPISVTPSRDAQHWAEGVKLAPEAEEAFDYVCLRDNRAGALREHWSHGGGGCSCLTVPRSTLTHEFHANESAPGASERPA
jgi:heterotetrameric sarcosine oxidase delta subunit